MKHVFHKLLAIFLTLALLCTCLPIAAFASDEATLFDIETPVIPVEKDSSETETPETDSEEDVSSQEDSAYSIGENGEIVCGPYEFSLTGDNDFGDGASLFEDWDDSWTSFRDQLSTDGKKVYDAFEEAFENGTIEYIVKYGHLIAVSPVPLSSSSEIDEIVYAFMYDHPEYFWFRSYYWYGTYSGGSMKYYPAFIVDDLFVSDSSLNKETLQSLQTEVDTTVNEILAECADAPVVVQLAYFDHWLAENNKYCGTAYSYGYSSYLSTFSNAYPWSIIGSLTDEAQPVCEGYAKAFELLCHKIGVPCIVVSSDSHMWNMVQLDGQWYCVDPTWDDPNMDALSYAYSQRSYFLISEEKLSQLDSTSAHTSTMSFACPDAPSNYFDSTEGFTWEDSEITGYLSCYSSDTSSYSYYIALYDANGKFLEIQPCISFQWTTSSTSRVLAPTFTNISSASSGKLFAVADDTSWTPKAAAVDITAG